MINNCNNCHLEIPQDAIFCPYCAVSVNNTQGPVVTEKVFCAICGEENNNVNSFCIGCGGHLTGRETPSDHQFVETDIIDTIGVEIGKDNIPKKPAIRVGEKQKYSQKVTEKKQSQVNSLSNEISNQKLILLFAILAVLGVLVLIASGSFSSGIKEESSDNIEQHSFNNEKNGSPDLGSQPIIDSLEAILKESPNDIETIKALAFVLHDARFMDRAIAKYKRYIELNPKNADMLVDLGVCYSEIKNLSEAESLFLSALKINENHPQALFNLGIVNLNMDKKVIADKWFNKVIEVAPGSPQAEQANKLLRSNSTK